MPLKRPDAPVRWTWSQAIAWIAFDMRDPPEHVWITGPAFTKQLGPAIDETAALRRAKQAISELLDEMAAGRLKPHWSPAPDLSRVDDPDDPDEWLMLHRAWAAETMLERLRGVHDLGGCELAGLGFISEDVLMQWQAQTARRAAGRTDQIAEIAKWIRGFPETPIRLKAAVLEDGMSRFECSERLVAEAWVIAAPASWKKRGIRPQGMLKSSG